eukprot:gene533-1186_t
MEGAFHMNQEVNNNINDTTSTANEFTSEKIEKLIKMQLLKYARRRRMKSKSGHYIEVRKDGTVRGTKDSKSPYTALQIMSIGSDMIAIWGTEAELYISINTEGEVKTTSMEGRQCVFIESLGPDFYSVYESYHSVFDGNPRCLIVNAKGFIELGGKGVLPGGEGQFIWEIN